MILRRNFTRSVSVTPSTSTNVWDLMRAWGYTGSAEGIFLKIGAPVADVYFGASSTTDNTNGKKIAQNATEDMPGYDGRVDPSLYYIYTTGGRVEINYLCR